MHTPPSLQRVWKAFKQPRILDCLNKGIERLGSIRALEESLINLADLCLTLSMGAWGWSKGYTLRARSKPFTVGGSGQKITWTGNKAKELWLLGLKGQPGSLVWYLMHFLVWINGSWTVPPKPFPCQYCRVYSKKPLMAGTGWSTHQGSNRQRCEIWLLNKM